MGAFLTKLKVEKEIAMLVEADIKENGKATEKWNPITLILFIFYLNFLSFLCWSIELVVTPAGLEHILYRRNREYCSFDPYSELVVVQRPTTLN